jgi:hypothetical protein
MLPVVSARKKMSGLGGIGDVSTDFEIVFDWPGRRVAVTVLGVTPGAAAAAAAMTMLKRVASAKSAATGAVLRLIRLPP